MFKCQLCRGVECVSVECVRLLDQRVERVIVQYVDPLVAICSLTELASKESVCPEVLTDGWASWKFGRVLWVLE